MVRLSRAGMVPMPGGGSDSESDTGECHNQVNKVHTVGLSNPRDCYMVRLSGAMISLPGKPSDSDEVRDRAWADWAHTNGLGPLATLMATVASPSTTSQNIVTDQMASSSDSDTAIRRDGQIDSMFGAAATTSDLDVRVQNLVDDFGIARGPIRGDGNTQHRRSTPF